MITEKGYVFVNIHGAQEPKLGKDKDAFNTYMIEKNRTFLQDSVKELIERTHVNVKDIFVMGDFNDRYDAIQDIEIMDFKLKYNGKSPYSCCHNWDSSCAPDRFNPFGEQEYGTCDPPDESKIKDNNKKLAMPDDECKITNYRYKGDKVFGQKPDDTLTIQIYKPHRNENEVSTESDHELVFALFNTPDPQQDLIEFEDNYDSENNIVYSKKMDGGKKNHSCKRRKPKLKNNRTRK